MVEKYVFKEPITLAQRFDGNPRKLIDDEDSGIFWFNLFNSGQAKYDNDKGSITVNIPGKSSHEIFIGDYIIYYSGPRPPYGGVDEIIRVDKGQDFSSSFETLENRNNRITRTGVSYEQ
jgi:hypothetical protein